MGSGCGWCVISCIVLCVVEIEGRKRVTMCVCVCVCHSMDKNMCDTLGTSFPTYPSQIDTHQHTHTPKHTLSSIATRAVPVAPSAHAINATSSPHTASAPPSTPHPNTTPLGVAVVLDAAEEEGEWVGGEVRNHICNRARALGRVRVVSAAMMWWSSDSSASLYEGGCGWEGGWVWWEGGGWV